MEAVFAVLWGWVFLGETLGERSVIGAALMLTVMILSQIQIPWKLNS
jgi:drug/metabolite transporter (DMT)-like permease